MNPFIKLPGLVNMMGELIQLPSVSSVNPTWDQSNQAVIEKLDSWLTDMGFETEVLAIEGYPGKFNLVATIGRGADGLILSGHTDTVPFDDGKWSQSPFALTERDNKLYGLGSCDMKGFFAVVIEALKGIELDKLEHPLIIIATADEESSMCGAKALKGKFQKLGRYTVIGEPTDLRPVRMHKGILMEGIRLIGRSGHSSNPALGVNALEGMHEVMDELLKWRRELQQNYQNPAFEIDVPTMNLGHIHGGDNPNRICAECELHIDLRPLPGMAIDSLREDMHKRIEQRLVNSGLKIEMLQLFEGIPAMETPAESAIVKAAEELTGYTAQAVAFGTEAPYFNDMNLHSIVMGPGSIRQAHQPDEFMPLDQVNPGIRIIQDLVKRFCF
jgi:acetylornithine deacetylase